MNNLRKIGVAVLVAGFLMALVSICNQNKRVVAAAMPVASIQKFYCNATLSDDFSDEGVIVVLDEESSRFRGISKQISQSLYSAVNVRFMEDLTMCLETDVNADGNLNPQSSPYLNKYYETASFRQILHIILAEPSKQNVLNAVDLIEDLEGVMYACPDMLEPVQSSPNGTKQAEQWALTEEEGLTPWLPGA